MSVMLNRDTNTITIANFWETYLLKKYNFEPPYQRYSVWTDEKQSFFIDSILKNFPVPPIFLHQHIDDSTGQTRYDVIDGKQRLTSIVRFIKGEIAVSSEFGDGPLDDQDLAGCTFDDLDKPHLADYKRRFWRYVVPIEYIDTPSPEVIDAIFDRLNRNGEPLRGQELRNAKHHGSGLLETVRTLARTPFWSARLEHVDVARMEDQEFVSELLFVILEGGVLEALPPIIDALYEKYTHDEPQWGAVANEFEDVTTLMESWALDYESYRIKGVSHLYGLWCLSWYCRANNVDTTAVPASLAKLFVELRSGDFSQASVAEYKRTMSSNTKSKSMRERRLTALREYCGV